MKEIKPTFFIVNNQKINIKDMTLFDINRALREYSKKKAKKIKKVATAGETLKTAQYQLEVNKILIACLFDLKKQHENTSSIT